MKLEGLNMTGKVHEEALHTHTEHSEFPDPITFYFWHSVPHNDKVKTES